MQKNNFGSMEQILSINCKNILNTSRTFTEHMPFEQVLNELQIKSVKFVE
jgi:hypothetical protein